jgi:hypothetical protein
VKTLILAATALALAGAAQAQTIWRCGNSYSGSPCPGGSTVAAVDDRPATDIEAAQRVAEREQHLAAQLRSERAQREGPPGSGLAGIRDRRKAKAPSAQPLRKPPVPKLRKRPEDPGTWPAAVPSSRRGRG